MLNRVLIYITAFNAGFVLMGYEIFGSRVLRPYFGSTIHVWGALIAVFMAGLSIGYAVGGKRADKKSDLKSLFILLFIPGLLLILFPVYGQRFSVFASSLGIDGRIEMLIASMFLFFLPSAFIGAVTPHLVKLSTRSIDNVGSGNGTVFAVTTLGSITGTLFSAFYLVGSQIGSSNSIVLMGVLLLLNSIILLFARKLVKTE